IDRRDPAGRQDQAALLGAVERRIAVDPGEVEAARGRRRRSRAGGLARRLADQREQADVRLRAAGVLAAGCDLHADAVVAADGRGDRRLAGLVAELDRDADGAVPAGHDGAAAADRLELADVAEADAAGDRRIEAGEAKVEA